jgi:predicted component of viral defense system (DUF524 family)
MMEEVRVRFPLEGQGLEAVPAELLERLAPARWVVREWRDYWLKAPEAAVVLVGSQPVADSPPGCGNYLIRFENQLGLATIRVMDRDGFEHAPIHVEVIAGKFGSAGESVLFLESTLAALFAQITTTPFVLGAMTERLVKEARRPPTPLFTFHFFRYHGRELLQAVQAILGHPHQRLSVEPELVRPHQVRQVDRESLVRMLQAGHPVPSHAGMAMSPLQRLRPERVWQQIPTETFDTPENRFVLTVARQMLGAARALQRQGWWKTVPATDKRPIAEAIEHLTVLAVDHRFAALGPMVVAPVQSRVLQRKDGYRDLAWLWQMFQRSREPLFEHMQQAISLRSVDQLYQLWVLFELIDQISAIADTDAVLTPSVDLFGVPTGGYKATFVGHGTLVYDQTAPTYSRLWLRPDYLWEPAKGGASVVLDAKFRLRKLNWGDDASSAVSDSSATTDDLSKMHAYRDAIPGVRAAVVLYPGTQPQFRDRYLGKRELSLKEVLTGGGWDGVGAIPLAPHGVTVSDGDNEDE